MADGFYRSGDIVRRLPGGELIVEGRIKDVINRGGEKVPVEEAENLLLSHPNVRDVVVVGVPDTVYGEKTCACVIARGEAPTLMSLRQHLKTHGIAAFKFPDRLVVLDTFPFTRLGKIDRAALASRVSSGVAS